MSKPLPWVKTNVSAPASPVRKSFPAPPIRMSLPALPARLSAPLPPAIMSTPSVPTRMSAPSVPLSVLPVGRAPPGSCGAEPSKSANTSASVRRSIEASFKRLCVIPSSPITSSNVTESVMTPFSSRANTKIISLPSWIASVELSPSLSRKATKLTMSAPVDRLKSCRPRVKDNVSKLFSPP